MTVFSGSRSLWVGFPATAREFGAVQVNGGIILSLAHHHQHHHIQHIVCSMHSSAATAFKRSLYSRKPAQRRRRAATVRAPLHLTGIISSALHLLLLNLLSIKSRPKVGANRLKESCNTWLERGSDAASSVTLSHCANTHAFNHLSLLSLMLIPTKRCHFKQNTSNKMTCAKAYSSSHFS